MDIEIRSIDEGLAEVRAVESGTSRFVEGYGIVFNSPSRLIENRFYEVILPEAVDGLIEKNDIFALMNHDPNRGILARSTNGRGSMKLTVDSKGVKYGFEAPKFDLGNELVEGIRRGDIRGSSFSFKVGRGGEKFESRGDGTYTRTISKFDCLIDMSPCYKEAYQDTTVALRSLDLFESRSKDLSNEVEAKSVIGVESIAEPIADVQEEKTPMSVDNKILRLKNREYKFYNK